jgi:SAM-dependent methyltransferase
MRLLHAGCGTAKLPGWFGSAYEEVRLDIDPETKPDVVTNITSLGDIGEFDVVYTSHCVEHLYPSEVRVALTEFHRVTAPGGATVIIVPDLEDVKATTDAIYECDGGPLCGLDLIYGCHIDILLSKYMAHHCGFVSETLEAAMKDAGFSSVTMKRLPQHNLMAVGKKES